MKYENASGLLPEELLRELQKYAAGKLLYVPENDEKKSWGEVSGIRQYLMKRNQMIINKYQYGTSIDSLIDEFCLSVDTIKRILYSKKTERLEYQPTSSSAIEYANAGMLEEWIQTYLQFVRGNKEFSDGLKMEYRYYIGPVLFPISFFRRSSGPEPDMKWQVHPVVFEDRVIDWMKLINNNSDVPPLIINYSDSEFEINCNNPLFEAMVRLQKNEHYIIFWITEKTDYDQFLKDYNRYLG